jgi:hypothetical protein
MRASPRTLVVAVFAFAPLLSCDESQTYHQLDPSWSRMLSQPRANAFGRTTVFEDGKVMRRPPRGTIPHDGLPGDPPPLTRDLVLIGRGRFETYCAVCHGILGDGHSVVAEKMTIRPPPSLGDARLRALAPDAIVKVIEGGYGLMPSYADAIDERDRWAVAAYVKALQLSQGMPVAELPPDLRDRLGLGEEAR